MGAPVQMEGRRFGRLVVLSRADDYISPGGIPTRRWNCRCDCGNEICTFANGLRSGHAKSCGCLQREVAAAGKRKHGLHNTPEYRIWGAMRARCQNPANESYPNYGGRGIKVCAEWDESFEAFFADMGPRPAGLTLERRDNGGDYEPGNCYWATLIEQGRNKRNSAFITFEGETLIVSEWARRFGVAPTTLSQRWKKFQTLRPVGRQHKEKQ